jgi:hypothetical protein
MRYESLSTPLTQRAFTAAYIPVKFSHLKTVNSLVISWRNLASLFQYFLNLDQCPLRVTRAV